MMIKSIKNRDTFRLFKKIHIDTLTEKKPTTKCMCMCM